MSLILERIQTEGIAELSYLVGDDKIGTAAVIDPRIDVDCYLELAREKKLSITHVFETHNHADLLSGARELAFRTGLAKVYLSHDGETEYGYPHEAMVDGDRFEFGSVVLTARHTPGHTTEHMSFIASEKGREEMPWGIFTGDSLFVSSAGRPDLAGSEKTQSLAEDLFDTLQSFKQFDDSVIIYPGHGHGSPCGADIGDRLESTIGYEKKFNQFLRINDKDEFIEYAKSTAPPEPAYYKRMKTVNARGPGVLGNLSIVPALAPAAFRKQIEAGNCVIVDTRLMLGFGGGHIKGALNIGARAEASIWAGWMLDPDVPILLVLETDSRLDQVIRLFWRTGCARFAGYLVGGMRAWDNAGFDLEELTQMTVQEVAKSNGDLQIIDVRSPGEWQGGHIPRAMHIFLPELKKRAAELDHEKPVVTYCDSGYRASLAASILQQEGFTEVHNVPGSWQAWQNARLPVAREH